MALPNYSGLALLILSSEAVRKTEDALKTLEAFDSGVEDREATIEELRAASGSLAGIANDYQQAAAHVLTMAERVSEVGRRAG